MKKQEEQFLQAYEEHADALFRYGFFKVNDRELAMDLLQETYMKTWGYIAKGGKIDSIKSFLYRTLSNLVIDSYRKHKTTSLDAMSENEGFDPGFDDTEKIFDTMDGKKAVEMLSRLPESYKEVLYMKYVEDLSIEEIADITGDSKNAVTVRIHRGMEKLRTVFNEHEK